MIDITAPETVEILIRDDKKVVWINVNGECVFRACRIGQLDINDPVKDSEIAWRIYYESLTESERTQLEAMSKGMKGYAS